MDLDKEFSQDEIAALRTLLETEKIRSMRHQYNYFIETRQLRALADLFTEDGLCEFGPYGAWQGRETIYESYCGVFVDHWAPKFSTLHVNSNHMIELTGADTATGKCYLVDVDATKKPDEQPIAWFAYYDEDYRKVDGAWKIARSTIEFIWPERLLTRLTE
jgi:hypothetical protein